MTPGYTQTALDDLLHSQFGQKLRVFRWKRFATVDCYWEKACSP